MINTRFLHICNLNGNIIKKISTNQALYTDHKCTVLVVGGGSGGCSVASKLCFTLAQDEVIVLEPSKYHYYQPYFTLIGGGIKTIEQSYKLTKSVLPQKSKWLKDSASEFLPRQNLVRTLKGDTIEYDQLVVAVGLTLNYDKIPGLVEGLSIPNGQVCSNYSDQYVERTFKALKNFKSGNALFTYPTGSVKCPGAAQKICYIAEHYFRKTGKRKDAIITYNSSLPHIFGCKKYANALWKVVQKRNIFVNLRTCLVEVDSRNSIAVFLNLDTREISTYKYDLLHVVPPMSTPPVLNKCTALVTQTGFLNLDKDTLQHKKFQNIFGLGDCSGTPNSKTAASIPSQCQVVSQNLKLNMKGKELTYVYDGYACCPMVTGYGSCIMAEFDYNLQPMETFPVDQGLERYSMYFLKKEVMPVLYWNLMLKGMWNGPAPFRKAMSFMKRKDNF